VKSPKSTRSSRQSFLGSDSDERLLGARVAIVGLGGGGSHIAQQLAHIGVGHFLLLDPDTIEESNLNRLVGGKSRDVLAKRTKVQIAKRLIAGINPDAEVNAFAAEWQTHARLLRGCDTVFGCVDSFVGRSELEREARRYHIPYIDIGMDVHEDGAAFAITGQVALSLAGRACLHCMNVLRPDLIKREAQDYGSAGARPQVVWPNAVLASTAVGMFIQLVTPWGANDGAMLLEYDGNTHEIRRSSATKYLNTKTCVHFAASADLGDPWFEMA
jgi:molybdopterin-synthase adenylyltransferase